jgi:hypothetical protein
MLRVIFNLKSSFLIRTIYSSTHAYTSDHLRGVGEHAAPRLPHSLLILDLLHRHRRLDPCIYLVVRSRVLRTAMLLIVVPARHLVLHLNVRLLDLVLRLVAENLAFLAQLI